jgi:hypothetical protein
MERKIVLTVVILLLLITVVTILANYFNKMSSTLGQFGLFVAMLVSIYAAYKMIKTTIKK